MLITKISMFSNQEYTMDLPITQEQLDKWENGALIQHVMLNLDADQREFLITGAIPGEWDRYLGFPDV